MGLDYFVQHYNLSVKTHIPLVPHISHDTQTVSNARPPAAKIKGKMNMRKFSIFHRSAKELLEHENLYPEAQGVEKAKLFD